MTGDGLKISDIKEWDGSAFKTEWLVEKFIPENELGTIFADPGTGKTMLLLDMALSGICGQDTMGHLETQKMENVLWCNQDMGADAWRYRVYRIAQAKDNNLPSGTLHSRHHEAMKLDTADGAEMFRKALAQTGADLVVIDSLGQHIEGDPSKFEDVRDMMDNVRDAMEDHPCTVVFAAHTNRDGGFYGSQSNEADVDFTWMAEPKPSREKNVPHDVIVRKGKARNTQPMKGFQYRIDPDTLESKWVRGIDDELTLQERLDVLIALQFAHKQERDPDVDEIRVKDFVEDKELPMGRRRSRRAFQLAYEENLLRLKIERGNGGAHLYEIKDEGREWYNEELEYFRDDIKSYLDDDSEQSSLEVEVDEDVMTEEDIKRTITGEWRPDEKDYHVEDRWLDPEPCPACGELGHAPGSPRCETTAPKEE